MAGDRVGAVGDASAATEELCREGGAACLRNGSIMRSSKASSSARLARRSTTRSPPPKGWMAGSPAAVGWTPVPAERWCSVGSTGAPRRASTRMFPPASSSQGARNASYTSGASRGSSRRSRFVLEKRDDGTLVRLREFGFRKLEKLIDNAGGWGEALTL